MAVTLLPNEIVVRDRQEWIRSMKAAYLVKRPNDDIGTGTWQDAIISCVGDQFTVQSASARTMGRGVSVFQVFGAALDARLEQEGLDPRFEETGATGFVKASTSPGGATINEGATLTENSTNAVFECAATDTYVDGQPVPVRGVSTGPATNFPVPDEDTVVTLTWDSPAAGLNPTATVLPPGLTGGRLRESDEQVQLRISDAKAEPAASGNPATYVRLAMSVGKHGVPVQQAFIYEATNGAGTIGLAFVLTPGGPGTSRIPTPAQIATVRNYLRTVPDNQKLIPPGSDLLLDTTILSSPVSIVLDVRWSQASSNWADSARWPPRRSSSNGAIVVASVTDATHFTLGRDDGIYAGELQPVVGQTICFYNKSQGVFARKRILTVGGTGPWPIVVDTSNNASDTTYVPVVGQRVSPWSKSIDDLVKPILDHFDKIGPGEQTASPYDPGLLQKRQPPSPEQWPSEITNHLVTDILNVPSVGNAIVQEGLGVKSPIGVPGALAYLLELADIAAFPLQ